MSTVMDVVMFDKWTQEDIEKLAIQCDLPTVPQTTRQSCWPADEHDDWDHGDLDACDVQAGSVMPNDVKVSRISGRML